MGHESTGHRSEAVGSTRRTFLKSATAIGGVAALAGCTQGSGGSTETIKFGLCTPFTGELGQFGETGREGAETAAAQVNDNGGIDGREVEVIQQDTKGEAQQAESAFRTLVSQGVVAIYGPFSGTIPSLFSSIRDEGVPAFTVAGTTYLDDKGGDWVFRVVGSDSDLGRARATYIVKQQYETVALAYLDNPNAVSSAQVVKRTLDNAGVDVVADVELSGNADSYRSEINQMVDADPDVVTINMGSSKFPVFIRNYRQVGTEIPIVTGNEVVGVQSIIDEVGAENMRGLVGVTPGQGATYDQYASAHEEVHGKPPGPYSAPGYDALNVTALSLTNADEISRQAVVDNLRTVSNPPGTKVSNVPDGGSRLSDGNEVDYDGAASQCNFDDVGDVVSPMNVMAFQDTSWTVTDTYTREDMVGK